MKDVDTREVRERKIKVIANNKKAYHDFTIESKIEAGIVLQGTEVKALRAGRCNLVDSYAGFKAKYDYELWIFNLHISEYAFGNRENHTPKRDRKLLINHREALKLKNAVMEKGNTLIPLSVYFSGHLVKVTIGLARAQKKHDKRETERKKEHDREIRIKE